MSVSPQPGRMRPTEASAGAGFPGLPEPTPLPGDFPEEGGDGTIYLDYNATTPLDSEICRILQGALESDWANPSSIHRAGRRARALLDDARDRVAEVLGCRPSEITFTSGGTEANNLAVLGAARRGLRRGNRLVCSPVEHPSVLACHQQLASQEGFELTLLGVDSAGRVDPDELHRVLRADTALVSVMAANNETGVVQPVAELGRVCREHGVPFHTDAVQCFGKLPFSGIGALQADLVPVCSHKFHGPKGIGALYTRSPLPLQPLVRGGSQEQERRAGTENLPLILGFAAALARFVRPPVFPAELLRSWTTQLAVGLAGVDGVHVVGADAERLPNTVSVTVQGTDSIAVLANLDLAGIAASSGSACSAGSVEPSHVLRAMGYSPEASSSLIRFSLGRENTAAQIGRVLEVFPGIVRRCREDSPAERRQQLRE